VLVAGGYNGSGLGSAELYDPATDSWSPAGTLTTARFSHTATLLSNGRVLVAGGRGNTGRVKSAELYDGLTTASTLDVDFADQTVATSRVMYLPVTNTADHALFVTGTTISGANAGDFAVSSDGCTNKPVKPDQSCYLGVRFTPAATGARSATLNVQANVQGGALTSALSGNGTTAAGGSQGEPGTPGQTGATGQTGAPGQTGQTGATGPPGANGAPGTGSPAVVTRLGLRGLLLSRTRGVIGRCASRSILATIAGTQRNDIRRVDFRLTLNGATVRTRRDTLAPYTMSIVRRGLITGRTYRLTATVTLLNATRFPLTRTFRAC
jgi:hypothetical protein